MAYAPDDPRVISNPHFRPFVAFDHPRVLIDNFDLTERTIRVCLRRAGWKKAGLGGAFIIHVRDEWAGGRLLPGGAVEEAGGGRVGVHGGQFRPCPRGDSTVKGGAWASASQGTEPFGVQLCDPVDEDAHAR